MPRDPALPRIDNRIIPAGNPGYCSRHFPFHYLPIYRHRGKSRLCKERGGKAQREGMREKIAEGRDSAENRSKGPPRATSGARLSVWSSATPRGDLIPSVLILSLLPLPRRLLSPSSTSSSSSSSRRRSLLSSSTGINLGRLHLYLMLPISRLILSAYSLPSSRPLSSASLYSLY